MSVHLERKVLLAAPTPARNQRAQRDSTPLAGNRIHVAVNAKLRSDQGGGRAEVRLGTGIQESVMFFASAALTQLFLVITVIHC